MLDVKDSRSLSNNNLADMFYKRSRLLCQTSQQKLAIKLILKNFLLNLFFALI